MKSILINVLIAFILILSMSSTLVYAQTPSSSSVPEGEKPVDESTVIFAGCRLSKLVAAPDPTKPLTADELKNKSNIVSTEKKGEYIKNCIQDIIRFIIVIASLAAILKIAASGVAMLDPTGSLMSSKLSSKSTITNLVIGLFLLIVGWNIIPILNNSFNNVDFLNLPGVNYCDTKSACISEFTSQANESKKAFENYKLAEKQKKISLLDSQRKEVIDGIANFCKFRTDKKYAADFTNAKLLIPENEKICTENKYASNLALWMKAGDSDIDKKGGGDAAAKDQVDKYTEDYKTAEQAYILFLRTDSPTQEIGKQKEAAITAACAPEKIKIFEETKSKITNDSVALKTREEIISTCKVLSGTDKEAIKNKFLEIGKKTS
jgi:hypothetical protein